MRTLVSDCMAQVSSIKIGRISLRRAAELLLPPIVVKATSRLGPAQWEYLADQWPANDPRFFGWDDPSVAQQWRQNWTAYKQVMDGTGPLAVHPWLIDARDFAAHNLLMIYGYILARAARDKKRISVLDWGGAMGHYAAVGKALVPEISLDFTVKERASLCEVGRELMPEVSFTSSDDESFSRRYDVVMASGSIQYAEHWQSMVRRLANSAERWLYITHVPVVHRRPGFVVVQRPQRYGQKADYISWVFNYGDFISHLQDTGLVLEREFITSQARQPYRHMLESAEMRGFLLRRP